MYCKRARMVSPLNGSWRSLRFFCNQTGTCFAASSGVEIKTQCFFKALRFLDLCCEGVNFGQQMSVVYVLLFDACCTKSRNDGSLNALFLSTCMRSSVRFCALKRSCWPMSCLACSQWLSTCIRVTRVQLRRCKWFLTTCSLQKAIKSSICSMAMMRD